jgi:hypothetical protein
MERATEAFWRGAALAVLADVFDLDCSLEPPEWAALAAVEAL